MTDSTTIQGTSDSCQKCGAEVPSVGAEFCGDCGAPLPRPSDVSPPTLIAQSHGSSAAAYPASVVPDSAAPAPSPAPPPVHPGPSQSVAAPPERTIPCSGCGQAQSLLSDRVACATCGQVRALPAGVTLTPPGRRLGQYLLDVVLAVVTLGIGYLIWSLIIWSQGQTPGMQVMHIKTVKRENGALATWGTMCLRQLVGEGVIMGIIFAVFVPAWIVLCCMLLWDKDRQQLWDKIAGTVVVDHYDQVMVRG